MVKKTIKKLKIKKIVKIMKKGGADIIGEQTKKSSMASSLSNSIPISNFNSEVIIESIKELFRLAQNGEELKKKVVNEIENKVNDLNPEDSPFLFQLKETALELLANINNYIEKCIEILMSNKIDNKKKNWYKMVLASDLICYLPEPVIKLISQKIEGALNNIENRGNILSASDKVSNNAFKNMLEILKSIFDIYYKICAIKNKIANIYLAIEEKNKDSNQTAGGLRKIKTKKIKRRYFRYKNLKY
jgi:hypothetical protein